MAREIRPPEILIANPEKVGDFYTRVLGWSAIVKSQESDEWLVRDRRVKNGEEDFIVVKRVRRWEITKGAPSYLNTFEVEDLMATLDKVREFGGTVEFQTEVTGIGIHSFCCDPEGNMFGLLEPRKR